MILHYHFKSTQIDARESSRSTKIIYAAHDFPILSFINKFVCYYSIDMTSPGNFFTWNIIIKIRINKLDLNEVQKLETVKKCRNETMKVGENRNLKKKKTWDIIREKGENVVIEYK